MSFQRRDVLTDRAESVRLRVLVRDPIFTFLFNMDDRLAWPFSRKTKELDEQVDSNDYTLVKSGPNKSVRINFATRAGERYKRFEPILNVERLLTPSGRGKAFAALNEIRPITRRIFDLGIRDWMRGGMTELALAPDWASCGQKPIVTTKLDTIELGQAKAHAREVACNASATEESNRDSSWTSNAGGFPRQRAKPISGSRFEVDRIVLRVFLHYYDWKRAERGRSLSDARTQMLTEIFAVQQADGSRLQLPEVQLPTLRQFSYWYYVLVDHQKRRKGIVGEIDYQQNERAQLGNEISKTLFVGAMGSGDATVWNIGLVSRFAGRRPIGCPIVFRIRCSRSGVLLGLGVGLDAASWIGMAAAIGSCLEDKVKLCARHGIHIEPWEWPVHGLPAKFEMDRGETDNHGPEAFIRLTAVEVINLMGQRPDLKPGIESDFRTLEVRLSGLTPAVIVETWENTQNSNWKVDGELDIDQFTRLLLKHELDRMKQPREGVLLDDKMIAAGVNTSPLSIWNYSLEHEGGGLSTFDVHEVQFALLPRDVGSITDRGVLFKGCYYLATELLALDAFSRARVRGRTRVELAFDPRLVDFVYLEKIGTTVLDEPIVCHLNLQLDHQLAFMGKCFAEVKELHDQQRQNEGAHKEIAAQSAFGTRLAHQNIVAEAKSQRAEQPEDHRSASEKVRSIPADRVTERNAHSPMHAFRPFSETTTTQVSNTPGRAPSTATVVSLRPPDAADKPFDKEAQKARDYLASLERRKQLSNAFKDKP
ncbi:MAG: hypothetical protein WCH35_10985 [Comamonadaceae bacterium]